MTDTPQSISPPCPSELDVAMRYIGKPWSDSFNCYDFCMEVYENALGRCTKADFLPSGNSPNWKKIDLPTPFCVVLMRSYGQAHAGIYLSSDHGGVLHCTPDRGVIFTSLDALRHMPIKIEAFYDYVH